MAPLSTSAFIIGAWLVSDGFLKVLNLLMLAPLSRLAFIIGAWLVLEWISKSSEFAGVASAVEVGLYHWGLACIRMDF